MIFVGYFDISTGIEITFPRDLHAIWSLSQTKLIVTRHKYALLTLSELLLMLIDVLTFEFNSNGQKSNESYRANPQEILFVLPYGSLKIDIWKFLSHGSWSLIKTEMSRPISLSFTQNLECVRNDLH